MKRAAFTHEVPETGELVIYDREAGRLLQLNEIGAAVWLLIDGTRRVCDIATFVSETLGADRQRVEVDVHSFIAGLEGDGVIELR
ncbi:MAG: PqqD family protein [Myxococcales bacterium]|nr:PqqD family protein [Myxococcales bacterium]